MISYEKRQGFTLVELSIVLVIIGLIVGGVLVGRDLVRTAELRSVITEVDKYKAAIYAFKNKYNALPGDFSIAGSVWPTCDAIPANCNGNGDTIITWNTEGYRAWQHLSLAGMIEGGFTGTATANEAVIGVNIPVSKIERAGYSFIYNSGLSIPVLNNNNSLNLGRERPNNRAYNAALKPQEALWIDAKADDGLPQSGRYAAYTALDATASCTAGATPNGVYNLANPDIACFLVFTVSY